MAVPVSSRLGRHSRTSRWLSLAVLARTLSLLTSRSQEEQPASLDSQGLTRQPAGARSGDNAFETFFRAHEREIFGYLWRVTGDEHASYDLAQETFVRAWQRFEQVRHYEQPRAWLFRVATNLASNHRRHRSIRAAATAQLGGGEGIAGDPAASVVESAAVRAALDSMPVKQRAALVLRVVYGLSIGELARVLGSSEAASKMTLARARERFRTCYTQEEPR
ncbi:MAG TPA: RNA polymerase sigma factor [Ktedonobacterales bacterium]|nr:RNA polymerase sigma factor [Ktedonobacterales bacterium]